MGTKKLYAHKMPGMVPILMPLYFLFGYKWGLTILVFLQFLLDALCCVLLGQIALKLSGNVKVFKLTFFMAAFSTLVSVNTHYAVSELFCTCFSILSIYFAICRRTSKDFLISGLFATWSIFFRPTSILLLLIIPLLILLKDAQKINFLRIKLMKKALILFFIPFVFFEVLWIARNYHLMNRFIPAEISQENFGTPALKSIFGLILAMGGDLQSWNPDSEMRWFKKPESNSGDSAYAKTNPFPDYVLRNGISLEDLKSLREKYYSYESDKINPDLKLKMEDSIVVQAHNLTQKFRSNAPFYFYVISPLRNLKTFLFIKRPYGFSFRHNGFLEKLIRLWHFAFYYIALVFFILGGGFFFRIKSWELKILILLPLLHVALYGLILRFSENRYLVPVYPYMVVAASCFLVEFTSRFKSLFLNKF